MKYLLIIGVKVIGVYFFYCAFIALLVTYFQYADSRLLDLGTLEVLMLFGMVFKALLYVTVGWVSIFRNEVVLTKFFNQGKVLKSTSKEINLSRSEWVFSVFKLAGFLLVVDSFVVLLAAVFPYLGILNSSSVLSGFLQESSFQIVKLFFGILFFFFTERIMVWINEK